MTFLTIQFLPQKNNASPLQGQLDGTVLGYSRSLLSALYETSYTLWAKVRVADC
jgi:hypothetical protein